jgi:Ulp1 family protease
MHLVIKQSDSVGAAEMFCYYSATQLLAKHHRAGIDIRRAEIRCMGAMGWLNDEVINIYMALLQVLGSQPVKTLLSRPYPAVAGPTGMSGYQQ